MTDYIATHIPCPNCSSSDGYTIYESGWGHCFVCKVNIKDSEGDIETKEEETHTTMGVKFLTPEPKPILERSITAAICKTHGYGNATYKGKPVEVANYRDASGKLIAQKLRTPEKKFGIIGDGKNLPLWQQHRYKSGGRKLLITEGELDLLCWQSINGKEWPAVSLPNGAPAAAKAIKNNLEYVESFDEVVLSFDMDKPGQEATEEVAALLTPGKAKVMIMPEGCKDICEAVQQGYRKQVIESFWQAGVQRPDGIVGSEAVLQAVLESKDIESTPYPWGGLNAKTRGLRMGELVTLTAGTGVGKSQACRVIAWQLIQQGHRVGYISLEESLARTGLGLLEQIMGKPLHLDRDGVTDDKLTEVWKKNLDEKICVFNHFGSMDAEHLLSRIKFMRVAEGCDFIIVDHLSILVSGWGDGDERRLIDNVMTALRSTVEQTGVGMVLVSHLTKSGEGKTFEEGGRPTLRNLRGSASISQLSDIVLGLVRDQQSETNPNITEVWVLKNRFSGETGRGCYLEYSPATGRLTETSRPQEAGDDFGFDTE